MTETNQNEQQIDLQIAPVETSITRETARLAFNFAMPGLVTRLYLYLFGEFDKEIIEAAVEKISERRVVMDFILSKEKTPLRAIYDFLIDIEFFEDQKLSKEAMVFIELPDSLQLRIDDVLTEEVERAVEHLSSLPSYSPESPQCQ